MSCALSRIIPKEATSSGFMMLIKYVKFQIFQVMVVMVFMKKACMTSRLNQGTSITNNWITAKCGNCFLLFAKHHHHLMNERRFTIQMESIHLYAKLSYSLFIIQTKVLKVQLGTIFYLNCHLESCSS